jgi:hypothetical protein
MQRLAVIVILLAHSLVAGCGPTSPQGSGDPAAPEPALAPTPGVPWFEDVTDAAGIDFKHFDSASPMFYIAETVGSGVGWIDYDNDSWPDLFCIQDCPVRPEERVGTQPTHKFYRNNGNGTFTDVTEAVGLNRSGYGMGCAVGDYDNDGFDDLVVTYLGSVSLFHNVANGTGGRRFEDVTTQSGIVDPDWATSCGWGDIDGDSFLDLYICNYVKLDVDNYTPCENPNARKRDICPPNVFPTVPHRLFRNRGDGTFADISVESGVAGAGPGYGFGVVLLDLDDDRKVDIYVANDMKPAYIFRNLGGSRFEEKGLYSGAALMPNGRFMAGMGCAVGDVDGSGRPSILVSNYQDEPTMVFLNRGKTTFQEWSHPSGLGPATMKTLGFGIDLFDADSDGNLDVAQANGHVTKQPSENGSAPYEQQAQMFVGDGRAAFREVSGQAGSYFQEKRVGRGLAVADYDNDGLPDFAVSHIGGPTKLLRNQTQSRNQWIRLELEGDGKTSNRNAIGSRIEIEAGGRKLVRWVHGGGSFLSASDRREVVGLGAATVVDRVTVLWPSGKKQEFEQLAAGTGWKLIEGRSKAEEVSRKNKG